MQQAIVYGILAFVQVQLGLAACDVNHGVSCDTGKTGTAAKLSVNVADIKTAIKQAQPSTSTSQIFCFSGSAYHGNAQEGWIEDLYAWSVSGVSFTGWVKADKTDFIVCNANLGNHGCDCA